MRKWWGFCLGLAAFVGSRVKWGQTLDFNPPDWTFMQFVDPALLKNHLWQSLFYLHSQPPGLNLLLGLVLKLFPGNETRALLVLYAIMGFILWAALYWLMVDMTGQVLMSALISVLAVMSPSTLLYEHYLYNTYPTVMFLCVAAWALNRFLQHGNLLIGIIFLIALDAVVMIHSTFQIEWVIVPLAAVYWFARERFMAIWPAVAASVGLIVLLYLKNAVLFGTFATSSWLGMNLSSVTTFQVADAERRRLVSEHALSPFALVARFCCIDNSTVRTGIPVLDDRSKGTYGPNWNNIAVVTMDKGYRHDAFWVIRHHPLLWLGAAWRACLIYFSPADEFYMLAGNRSRLGTLNDLYGRPGRLYIIGFVLILIFSAGLLIKTPVWGATEITIFFMLFTIVYVTLASNLIEIGENQRMRYAVDPFFVALLAVCLSKFGAVWRSALALIRAAHIRAANNSVLER